VTASNTSAFVSDDDHIHQIHDLPATMCDRMVELVERMLSLHKELAAAKTPAQHTVIQRQIEATDRQIDQLVYELYGLTDEEIKIVEAE
jgi:hypothetical protein